MHTDGVRNSGLIDAAQISFFNKRALKRTAHS
jgi:hypothetical protein